MRDAADAAVKGTAAVVRRPGGRTARTRAAVQDACLRLLAQRGVQGFGMEELAEAAGVHKSTLYRRWPSMAQLLGDVAAELIGHDVPVPDTGALAGDLTAMARSIAAVIRHPVNGPALTALFTAPAGMAELDAVIDAFWARRLELLRPVAERAVARGELAPDVAPELMFECLGAPLYYRLLMTRQPVDDAAVRRAVRITIAAAAAGAFTASANPRVAPVAPS